MNKPLKLPGLNSLRFWAAMTVVACHTEQLKMMFGIPHYFDNAFVNQSGGYAVTFFFVLSGFLITYLLLLEKRRTGTINVLAFYRRRALRIIPLYCLIVLLAFFLLPNLSLFDLPGKWPFPESTQTNFDRKLTMFALMIPNWAIYEMPPVAYASHLWSVGTEEQFYSFWPLLLLLPGRVFIMVVMVVAFMLLPSLHPFFFHQRMGCMAIGGLAAWMFLRKWPISNRIAVAISLLLVVGSLTYWPFWYGREEAVAWGFALLIVNVAAGTISISTKLTEHLGEMSYGIYMLHIIAVVIAIKLLPSNPFPIAALLTILLAYTSYYILEKPFLAFRYQK